MARIILKRDFDFFLGKVRIVANGEVMTLGSFDVKTIDLPDGENRLTISAMGYYSQSVLLTLEEGNTLVVRQYLPRWYYMAFLSVMSICCTLGLLGLIPNIVGSSVLLLFLISLTYVNVFKRNRFFKVDVH